MGMLVLYFNLTSDISQNDLGQDVSNKERASNNIDVEYMKKLVTGEIQAKNEDKDFSFGDLEVFDAETENPAISNYTSDGTLNIATDKQASSVDDDFKLVDRSIIIDNQKIEANSNDNVETYCANIVIHNTFEVLDAEKNTEKDLSPVLSQSDQDKEEGVTVGAKITYSKIKVGSVVAYKISSMSGKYISSTNKQMICSYLKGKTRAHAASKRYNSSGKAYKPGNEDTGKVAIKKSPIEGTWYNKSTGQTYYYRSDDSSYNKTNIYYTVKRTVSSFTKEYYIPLGFGSIASPI